MWTLVAIYCKLRYNWGMVKIKDHNLDEIAELESSPNLWSRSKIASFRGICRAALGGWIERECKRKGLVRVVTVEYKEEG